MKNNKSFIAIILLALVGALAVPAVMAEESVPVKKVSKKTLEKYDTDKDGKLSAAEEAAMKADKAKARAERHHQKTTPETGSGSGTHP